MSSSQNEQKQQEVTKLSSQLKQTKSQLSQTKSQLSQLRSKYENQVKKNNNLLKMNSNLMKQNQIYQNCLSQLKKWYNKFLSYPNNQQVDKLTKQQNRQQNEQQQIDDSCIDIEEQGEEFIQLLTQQITHRFQQLNHKIQQYEANQLLNQNKSFQFTQTKTLQPLQSIKKHLSQKQSNQTHKQYKECSDCQRWKQLYLKQSKQTIQLQKLLQNSNLFNNQKSININKLKSDISKLLQDYWTLYRKQFTESKLQFTQSKLTNQKQNQLNNQTNKQNNKQTQRPKDQKSKQKRSGSSGNKPKKISIAVDNKNNKQTNAFSKQKTTRNTVKYTINFNSQKQTQNAQNRSQLLNSQILLTPQLSEKINSILTSYTQVSKSYQDQNTILKEQIKEFNQILTIYRQKQRNRLLLK